MAREIQDMFDDILFNLESQINEENMNMTLNLDKISDIFINEILNDIEKDKIIKLEDIKYINENDDEEYVKTYKAIVKYENTLKRVNSRF